MMQGSNRLPALLNEIKNANVVFASAQRLTSDAALVMGKSLNEAKDLCGHGEWTDFVGKTGLSPRTAQRYMRLASSGFNTAYIGLVGVTEALQEIDEAQEMFPALDKAVMAVWETEFTPDTMIWWRLDKHKGSFLQAYNDPENNSAKFLVMESIPIVFIAFIVECFHRGFDGSILKQERYRKEISLGERDQKLAFLQDEAAKFAQGGAS